VGEIKLSPSQKRALKALNSDGNVFMTGAAGSGKSFLLRQFLSPKDPKTLVYSTKSALVMSKDGGTTWSSKKLPTTRGVAWMVYSREEKPALILGAAPVKK
jgi:ABC-type ATPase involved in cell division